MKNHSAYVKSTDVTWRCFQCGHTVLQPPVVTTRDGGLWCHAPPDWLFVADGDELTFVCSQRCLTAIYTDDT